MTSRTAGYIMDDPREARRLAGKVDAPQWVATYLQSCLAAGARVLDVGCGPGVIAAEIAGASGVAQVVGLDLSRNRMQWAGGTVPGSGVSAVQGDAASLPFLSDTFDVVIARFLLEYVPSPGRVVAEMVRVCRPRGVVVLQDLDGQMVQHHPPDPALQHRIDALLSGLAPTGFDPFIGRKLFNLAHQAGLHVQDVRVEAYHLIAGRVAERTRRLWELKLDIGLAAGGAALESRQEAAELKAGFLRYLDRDDTVTWSTVFTVWASKQ